MREFSSLRVTGTMPGHLQPTDKPVPMVATADVGRVAAELLQRHWTGRRVVELEGPQRVTPDEIPVHLSTLLGRAVVARPVPRADWEAGFRAQGMRHPTPRMRMLDGFNDGWIEFEGTECCRAKGRTTFQSVLQELAARPG